MKFQLKNVGFRLSCGRGRGVGLTYGCIDIKTTHQIESDRSTGIGCKKESITCSSFVLSLITPLSPVNSYV